MPYMTTIACWYLPDGIVALGAPWFEVGRSGRRAVRCRKVRPFFTAPSSATDMKYNNVLVGKNMSNKGRAS